MKILSFLLFHRSKGVSLKPLNIHKMVFFMIFSLCLTGAAFGQKKNPKKADKLYKDKKYAAAIPLYENALEAETSVIIMSKLARCYFQINQLNKAVDLYQILVEEHDPKVKIYFQYAECLKGLGKYDLASLWYYNYFKISNDSLALTKMNEIGALSSIVPIFKNVEIMPFSNNSDQDEFSPFLFGDEMIYTTDTHIGLLPIKVKSKTTGKEYLKIASSKMVSDEDFLPPRPFVARFNYLDKNTSSLSITADGLSAFFSRNTAVANASGTYTTKIFYSERNSIKGSWKTPRALEFQSDRINYMHPFINAGGDTLYYSTDSKKGYGGLDIYYSTKTKRGEWSTATNLGPTINTPGHEGFPFSVDGMLFFSSKGHLSYGGYDVCYAIKGDYGEYGTSMNVGKPVNSAADDISIFIDTDRKLTLFTSSRSGESDDIYLFNYDRINLPDPDLEISVSNKRVRPK